MEIYPNLDWHYLGRITSSAELKMKLEARVGIEPTHKGFADLSLTTWVPRPERECPYVLALRA